MVYTGLTTRPGSIHIGRYDYFHGQGEGVVAGTVKTKGTPANFPTVCKVWLFRYEDWLTDGAHWTDAVTGAFSFTQLNMDYTYCVVAIDHTLNRRAVIMDRVAPILA